MRVQHPFRSNSPHLLIREVVRDRPDVVDGAGVRQVVVGPGPAVGGEPAGLDLCLGGEGDGGDGGSAQPAIGEGPLQQLVRGHVDVPAEVEERLRRPLPPDVDAPRVLPGLLGEQSDQGQADAEEDFLALDKEAVYYANLKI